MNEKQRLIVNGQQAILKTLMKLIMQVSNLKNYKPLNLKLNSLTS